MAPLDRADRVAAYAADAVFLFYPSGFLAWLHGLVEADFQAASAVDTGFRGHFGLLGLHVGMCQSGIRGDAVDIREAFIALFIPPFFLPADLLAQPFVARDHDCGSHLDYLRTARNEMHCFMPVKSPVGGGDLNSPVLVGLV